MRRRINDFGAQQGFETAAQANAFVAQLKKAGVDTVILGCTHYPLVLPVFERLVPAGVRLLDTRVAQIRMDGMPERDDRAASPCWQRGDAAVGQCVAGQRAATR